MADNVSGVKNQLTTMYGGGYARLADSQGNIYRLVNILEATVNFDTKQDFLRAIYPNSPSQVIAVATTENNVTLMVKMGEFTKEFIGLASNLTYSMLTEASFPVYNETHIMLTTRTRLRYTPLTGSTVHVYHRNKGIETELTRVGGLVVSSKVVQKAVSGQSVVYVEDTTGFVVGQSINVGTQNVGAVTAIDPIAGSITFTTALASNFFPFSSGTVITNATTGSGATTAIITADAAAGATSLTVNSAVGFKAGDQFSVGAEDHELYTISVGGVTDNTITFSPGLLIAYTGPHNQDFVTLAGAGTLPAPGEYALDVDEIVVHPSIVGQGLSVDYERRVGDGTTKSVYKIGGDQSEEIGYCDFHLVLQNQQGKWLYYRFPGAIPTGKYSLDMKGSFMNLPQDFTAITPPGWVKPYLLLGEL
jgi:hypothetical protein